MYINFVNFVSTILENKTVNLQIVIASYRAESDKAADFKRKS